MARILTFNHKIINPGNNRYFGSFGSGPTPPTPPEPPQPTVYDVILTTDGHGSITANPMSGAKDTLITLSNTPAQNYVFSKYTLNNVDLAGNTFLMPEADANVKGWFEADVRTITVTQPSHGTITAPASAQVGSTVTLSCTADTGYALQYFTVNGSQIQGNSFVMPASNVTVSASLVGQETYTFYTNNAEAKELHSSRISTQVPEGKTVKSYVIEMELNNNPDQLYLTTDGETYQIIGLRGDSYGHSGTWDVLELKDYNYSLNPTITYMNSSLVKNNDIRYYYSSHVGYTWCYTITGINPLWTDGWHKLKIVLSSSSNFSNSATISIYRDDVLLLTGNITGDFPYPWPIDSINLTGTGNTKKIRNVNYYAVVE